MEREAKPLNEREPLKQMKELEFALENGRLICPVRRPPHLSRSLFPAVHPAQLMDAGEGPHWLDLGRMDQIWNRFKANSNLEEAQLKKVEELCRQGQAICVNPGWIAPGLREQGWGGREQSGDDRRQRRDDFDWKELSHSVACVKSSECSCPGLSFSKPLRLNLVALGDVGSTVLMGLKLLGGERLAEIGIWDMNPNQSKRWEFEMNQTAWAWEYDRLPPVRIIEREELFDCDVLVFCASKGIPPVKPARRAERASDFRHQVPGPDAEQASRSGNQISNPDEEQPPGSRGQVSGPDVKQSPGSKGGIPGGDAGQDVRMAQYEANRELICSWGREARKAGFSGLFAVVSDPVDPLCRGLFYASNRDQEGNFDGKGLRPEQIQGYGLGVMNARAAYYAKKDSRFASFLEEGRSFGPHGKDLVIANSISHYDGQLSVELTRLAAEANLRMRDLGFKPYVAPALSSAAISILQTVSGQWHYSSYFLGGVFMGSKNRLTGSGLETEVLSLPSHLYERILAAYEGLLSIEP